MLISTRGAVMPLDLERAITTGVLVVAGGLGAGPVTLVVRAILADPATKKGVLALLGCR